MATDLPRSHADIHDVLELEIRYLKERVQQNHTEMVQIRRTIRLFVERYDHILDREIQHRERLRDALYRMCREIHQAVERFLEHDVGN